MSWEAFAPRTTAAPLVAARRRLAARAETEALQESWFAVDGQPSAWRVMISNNPAFAIAVIMWVDGRPVRPGLEMRVKMAINSIFGSAGPPMIMTVSPMVDWDKLNENDRMEAENALSAFLLVHHDLNPDCSGAVGAVGSFVAHGLHNGRALRGVDFVRAEISGRK